MTADAMKQDATDVERIAFRAQIAAAATWAFGLGFIAGVVALWFAWNCWLAWQVGIWHIIFTFSALVVGAVVMGFVVLLAKLLRFISTTTGDITIEIAEVSEDDHDQR